MQRIRTYGILISAALLAFGCGSSSSNNRGTGGAGGAGGAGTGGGTVTCGPNLACTGGDQCCIPLSGSDPPSCAADCPSGTSPASCDGPEDCGGGPCCGNVAHGYKCAVGDACSPGESQRCHNQLDCNGGACVSATFGSTPVDACQ